MWECMSVSLVRLLRTIVGFVSRRRSRTAIGYEEKMVDRGAGNELDPHRRWLMRKRRE